MNEFKVECYINFYETQEEKIINLNKKNIQAWINDMEVRALSQYYNKKIKIVNRI